jgi:hypothetical protein
MIAILSIIILLVVVGFALWLLNFLPIVEPYKQIIFGIVIFLVVIYILELVLGGPAIFSLK